MTPDLDQIVQSASSKGNMAANDAFDDLLNLEEEFYSEGYEQGVADGERAGRIEGRAFGIEKGFEKFVEAGRLHGKSIVWANRLPQAKQQPRGAAASPSSASTPPPGDNRQQALPVLSGGGARLEKNIVTLHALVEPDTLSTDNTDDAVNDFDDRVKRAQGKVRVIERHVGEDTGLNAGVKDDSTAKAAAGGDQASSSAVPPSKEAVSF
ncbi:hypothetical protein SLS64_000710 [Diaporthe eres]|uniref:Essential protein Yae1 N-terminal domain-containing protein n=1 Tax=Diaporthe eres TaxID=83184 RepID=A0ABR1P551_DIAER